MSRLTGKEVYSLMEAYQAVYQPELREDYLFEKFLNEEFILESYQSVADYLVHNNFVPGYATAEVYMSEMDDHDIDDILIECGLHYNKEYYNEGLTDFANQAISGVKKVATAGAGALRSGAGVVDRGASAVSGGIKSAGQVARGTAIRAGNVVKGAGQAALGTVQRAGGAVVKAATPVAQAVKGTAIRAVDAGKSALKTGAQVVKGTATRASDAVGRQVQGGIKNVNAATQAVGGAVQGGIKNVNAATKAVGGAVQGAGRAIANEVEVSRRSGGGLAGPKIVGPKIVGTGPRNFGSPSLASQNQSKKPIMASFDYFDTIKGHLIDEGYADTEHAALQIMANMSDEWFETIVEGSNYDKNRQRAAKRAAERNEARKRGQTGNVPGIGYVSPRPERETYRDAAGVERHTSGARMPKKDEGDK